MRLQFCIPLALFAFSAACAQQSAPTNPPIQQTVVVVGQPEPVSLGDSPRAVVVLDTQQHPLAFEAPADYLRTDPSVYIEQRGAGGGQADIVMRGATFEQTLVLLNGLRFDDAQTSHHNLDLPVPLEAMRGIQVLHGAGSTLYGADALGGVVDFLTAEPDEDSMRLRAGAGSFGENEQSALIGAVGRRWSEMLTGSRNFSTGFIAAIIAMSRQARSRVGRVRSASRIFCWPRATGHSARANFMGRMTRGSERRDGLPPRIRNWVRRPKPRSVIGGIRMSLVLDRYQSPSDPSYYENNHIDSSWQGVLRRNDAIARGGRLFYGA